MRLSRFDGELMLVIDVLIGTAAASAEIRARRRGAMERRFLYIDQVSLRELFALADDPGTNEFVFDHVGHKHHLAACAPDAFPAETDVFDFKIDQLHKAKVPSTIEPTSGAFGLKLGYARSAGEWSLAISPALARSMAASSFSSLIGLTR